MNCHQSNHLIIIYRAEPAVKGIKRGKRQRSRSSREGGEEAQGVTTGIRSYCHSHPQTQREYDIEAAVGGDREHAVSY